MVKKIRYKASRWSLASRALRRVIIQRLIFPWSDDTASFFPAFLSHYDLIGIEVLCSGTFEKEFLALSRTILAEHISCQKLGPGPKVAIDVGANIGTHALYLSTIVDRVLAFEPNPPVALVCRANKLVAARANIEIFDIALSDHSGIASLLSGAKEFGGASLDRSDLGTSLTSVRVELGDSFIQPLIRADERVVLIKIDVEGHEPKVLKGILNVVRRHRPVIIFESSSRAHLSSCTEILESVGYMRFDAVQKDWEDKGGIGKLLTFVLGRTEISLKPIDRSQDHFYSSVVARPSGITNL
jgi:FkbM family methyltransferase